MQWAGRVPLPFYLLDSSLRTGPLAPALPRSLIIGIDPTLTLRATIASGRLLHRSISNQAPNVLRGQFWSCSGANTTNGRGLKTISGPGLCSLGDWDHLYLEGGALVMTANEVLASDITVSPVFLL